MIATFWTALGVGLLLLILAGLLARCVPKHRQRVGRLLAGGVIAVSVPILSLALYLGGRWAIGQPAPAVNDLPNGVGYRRHVLTTPNRAVVHSFEITDPAKRQWVVTRPIDTAAGPRTLATRAKTAAVDLDADLLINANFFMPFYDYFLFCSEPNVGDEIEPIGEVVSDGVRFGRPKPDWPSAWQRADGSIGFGGLPGDARNAITGRQWLLKDGEVALRKDEPPYPRSALAMNASGDRLWLVVVDGKQPRYSLGLTLSDFAAYLKSIGASHAIELDGGGSSILVHRDTAGTHVLSRPCHEQIPGRQRPTGVFLGIRLSKPTGEAAR